MQKDVFYYYNQLFNKWKQQEERIIQLEKRQKEYEKELEALKNQPAVNIERIDYQFDQLKIERLEGTLNIGLTPHDLQDMDEFSIGQGPFPPYSPHRNEEIIEKLENKLNDYLSQELAPLVDKTKEELNLNIDSTYTEFIKQDIERQLPSRISYYLQRSIQEQGGYREELDEHIINAIKKDIQNAVHAFLNQFPKKGDGAEK